MKEKIIKLSISTAVASLLLISNAWSCTEMRVTAENGASVIGRSMEFGNDPESNLVIQPRGQKRSSSTPGGGKGTSWILVKKGKGFLYRLNTVNRLISMLPGN